MYGYRPEEIIGKNVALLAPPDRPNEIAGILERLRHGKRTAPFETERVTKDGRRINVSLSISPVFDEEGKISEAATIASNITDRQSTDTAWSRAQKPATAGGTGAIHIDEMNKSY